jgi:hypothetical protein
MVSEASATAAVIRPVALHLGEVPHPPQQAVGDPRRAAGPARDLRRAGRLDRHAENSGRADDDAGQLLVVVEIEVVEDPEPLAERRAQHAGPRGGAHQREGLERDPHGPRVHPRSMTKLTWKSSIAG